MALVGNSSFSRYIAYIQSVGSSLSRRSALRFGSPAIRNPATAQARVLSSTREGLGEGGVANPCRIPYAHATIVTIVYAFPEADAQSVNETNRFDPWGLGRRLALGALD